MQGTGRVILALVAVALAVPATAEARGNCCFELAATNTTYWKVDYMSDGFGYDGTFEHNQEWYVRAIVSERRRGDELVKVRDAYSLVRLFEIPNVTQCADFSRPCLQNRERVPCSEAQNVGGSFYENRQDTTYAHDAGLIVTAGRLYAAPPDPVYYSVDDLNPQCHGSHGYEGFGEEAVGVASQRSMSLKPPNRGFLRTAHQADRCSQEFTSGLVQGPDHVGSDSAAPHTFESSLNATYFLSWFPRKQLRKQRRELAGLAGNTSLDEFFDDPFYDWGKDGTGNQRC